MCGQLAGDRCTQLPLRHYLLRNANRGRDRMLPRLGPPSPAGADYVVYEPGPPTHDELDAVLTDLNSGHEVGPDACPAELYKLLDGVNRRALHDMVWL